MVSLPFFVLLSLLSMSSFFFKMVFFHLDSRLVMVIVGYLCFFFNYFYIFSGEFFRSSVI